MQLELDISQIKRRAREAGFLFRDVCRKAGVSPGTPSRIKRRGKNGGRVKTMVALNLALMALEKERLAKLTERVAA